MNPFFLVVIVVIVSSCGLIALHRFRGSDGYKRRFANGARMRGDKSARGAAAYDSSLYVAPIGGGVDGGHAHGAADCGTGHGGGDAGGSCSDGGGGGGGDGGGGH
jgi:hypothetical protein